MSMDEQSLDTTATSYEADDIVFLLLILRMLSLHLGAVEGKLQSLLICHIKEQNRLNRSLPTEKRRITWCLFKDNMNPTHFQRMFRVTSQTFDLLCSKLCERVGENVFNPEDPQAVLSDGERTIPLICGEVKVAFSLRMLAGGSYLDLVPLFNVSVSHFYQTFNDFVSWVLMTFNFLQH